MNKIALILPLAALALSACGEPPTPEQRRQRELEQRQIFLECVAAISQSPMPAYELGNAVDQCRYAAMTL